MKLIVPRVGLEISIIEREHKVRYDKYALRQKWFEKAGIKQFFYSS